MKRRVSIAGLVPVLAVSMAMVACSHNKTQEKESGQQAGQSAQSQKTQSNSGSQAQTGQTAQSSQSNQANSMMLGEQNTSAGTAQIQRQKKVVSTVIVKEKIPTVKESTIRADINRMDAKQFTAIGFPSDVSQSIVQYRDRNGPFHSVNDLSNVDGVSQSLLDKFDGSLGVNQSAAGISGQSQGMTNQQTQSGSQSNQQQPGQQGSSSSSNQDYPAYDSSSPNLNQ